jgi:hypothetical protein
MYLRSDGEKPLISEKARFTFASLAQQDLTVDVPSSLLLAVILCGNVNGHSTVLQHGAGFAGGQKNSIAIDAMTYKFFLDILYADYL